MPSDSGAAASGPDRRAGVIDRAHNVRRLARRLWRRIVRAGSVQASTYQRPSLIETSEMPDGLSRSTYRWRRVAYGEPKVLRALAGHHAGGV